MKILCFVDLHGDMIALRHLLNTAKRADILLCAGDISNFEHNLSRLLKQLNSAGRPVLIIPGNHEGEEPLRSLCDKHPNLIYLHKGLFELSGVSFIGYGFGGFSTQDREFERFGEQVSKHTKGKLVLITHAPPYGTSLDNLYGEHRGNRSIRNFIIKHKPLLAVSGHFHETAGAEDTLGPTRLINPGKKGKIVLIAP